MQVGSEVARRGIGLGFANVIAYDPYASEVKAAALGVKLVSWEEALAQADFFSLHMPQTPQTKVRWAFVVSKRLLKTCCTPAHLFKRLLRGTAPRLQRFSQYHRTELASMRLLQVSWLLEDLEDPSVIGMQGCQFAQHAIP